MIDHFINKLRYEFWANDRIIDSLKKLPLEDNKCNWLLSHILAGRVVWLERILNIKTSEAIWTEQSLSTCVNLNQRINDNYLQYFNSLSEVDLKMTIAYQNIKGDYFHNELQEILFHVFNHSTYHRGQIVSRLKELSTELPVTDYIVFAREK